MGTKKITPLYAETRILLQLIELGESEVSPSKFTPSGDQYKKALVRLVEESCLNETLKGSQHKKYSLTSQGKQRLINNLSNEEFVFFGNVGPKTTNGILKVFCEAIISSVSLANGSADRSRDVDSYSIASYESFSNVTLDVYEKLNSDFQCEDLVPIYRIRRTIGGQVSRAQFNEWLLEMQANEKLQLIGGAIPDLKPDQAEDSITTSLGGIRYYAKRLST